MRRVRTNGHIKLQKNFIFCNANTSQTVNVTNASTTLGINTNYHIDWGDGSPVFNSATFNSTLTHTYAPGSYKITFTVTGSTAAPCNVSRKTYNVLIGKAPTISISASTPTVCIPSNYELPINLAQTTGVNPASTLYKVFVNGELDTIYDNTNLPALLPDSIANVTPDENTGSKNSVAFPHNT